MKVDKNKWESGTITETGTANLFAMNYHSAWLLVGWLLAGHGAGNPTVCIAVDGAAGTGVIKTISDGTSVSFLLAEDGRTIQFKNPYGNVCFWHAVSI